MALESLRADMQAVQSLPDLMLAEMDHRFKGLEETVVSALRPPKHAPPPYRPAPCRDAEPSWASGICHIASAHIRTAQCVLGCTCDCHSIARYSLRFAHLASWAGSIAVGYRASVPAKAASCSRCGTRRFQTLNLVYHFPSWVIRASLIAVCLTNLNGAPQLNLRVISRVGGLRSPGFINGIFGYILTGDVDGVKELLVHGQASVHDILEPGGSTALQAAMNRTELEIAQLLLHAGADPYHGLFDQGLKATPAGLAVQIFASRPGGPQLDSHFSKLFSLPDYIEHANYTPLHLAALGVLHFDLEKALKHNPELAQCIDQRAEDGLTPLDAAALAGNLPVTEALLRAGADPNVTDWHTGYAPLAPACLYSHTGIVKLLLSAGAPVTWPSRRGLDALHCACRNSSVDPTITHLLIQHGANVNTETAVGKQVPLDYAAGMGNLEAVRILLDNGADINHRDGEGETAIVTAVQNRNPQMASVLIARGADLGTVNEYGDSLLHQLAAYADAATMRAFAEFARDHEGLRLLSPRARNADGRTPLQVFADRDPGGEMRKALEELLDAVGCERNVGSLA
ncbi:hypothetical protein OQA88_1442 [Cercophora sp. LCS_1]